MVTTRTLDVPGAHLYYESRGSGPVLVLTGAPRAAEPPMTNALEAWLMSPSSGRIR